MTDEQILRLHMQRARANYPNDEDVKALLGEVERLHAEIARKKAALIETEWVWTGYGSSCPWCYREKSRGHAGDCPRQAALSPAPELQP